MPTGFRITLSSLGENLARTGLESASFRADASFLSAYAPPGEVSGLHFTDDQTLTWSAERSAGTYSVYRDQVSALVSGGYGTCLSQELSATSTSDPATPPTGGGFFYLVTVENRLREEGTKGSDSSGAERGGNECP